MGAGRMRWAATVVAAAVLMGGATGCRPTAGQPLKNAGLEEDAGGDGMPDCFTPLGWGRNTWAYSTVADGRGGTKAGRVAVTARTDGERLLAVSPDDVCSPATTEGGWFTAVAWYRSTVPVTMVAYAQRTTGWSLWFRGAPLPASAGFREARVPLPAVPAGVTGVSFGLAISAVGEVVTDDYALEVTDPSVPSPAPQADCRDGYVALTYDDGPVPETAGLLDALAAKGAKATFFVIGRQIAGREAVVARQVAEGHVVGNHSWDHPDLTTLTADQIRDQLGRTSAGVEAAGAPRPTLFRPPYGAVNDQAIALGREAGMVQVRWSIDTFDWRDTQIAVDELARRALDGARAGSVVLFHDRMPTSVAAVPAIVDGLRMRGLCPGVIRARPDLSGYQITPT